MCSENGGFLSQLPAEGLVQQGFFQLVEGGELALVEEFEALGFSFVHGYPWFALKHLTK